MWAPYRNQFIILVFQKDVRFRLILPKFWENERRNENWTAYAKNENLKAQYPGLGRVEVSHQIYLYKYSHIISLFFNEINGQYFDAHISIVVRTD